MAGENHGAGTMQEQEAAQELGGEQTAQEQQEMTAAGGIDYEKQIAERNEKIAALEAQVAEAVKNVETAEQLRGEIASLKQQFADERVDFSLQLAGCRNVKAARATRTSASAGTPTRRWRPESSWAATTTRVTVDTRARPRPKRTTSLPPSSPTSARRSCSWIGKWTPWTLGPRGRRSGSTESRRRPA